VAVLPGGPPDGDEVPEAVPHPPRVDAALMFSWGAVYPGREALAVELFTEISRYLGRLLADEVITTFEPFFFADGLNADVSGFFLMQGRRERLDELRRDEAFTHLVLRVGAGAQNVRVHTLVAGSEAGRLVNLYREVRTELGLI
jgi:hypothetical protein